MLAVQLMQAIQNGNKMVMLWGASDFPRHGASVDTTWRETMAILKLEIEIRVQKAFAWAFVVSRVQHEKYCASARFSFSLASTLCNTSIRSAHPTHSVSLTHFAKAAISDI